MLNKKNAIPWKTALRPKVGDIVVFEENYYINYTGFNSIPTNVENWIFEGSVLPSNGGNDAFYGPFDDAANAFALVPVEERKVTKLLSIYSDPSKTFGELYMWSKDLADNWAITKVNDQTQPFQIVTLGSVLVNTVTSKITVNVHHIGLNQIRLDGILWTKSSLNEFTIDPIVTAGNFRKDIIEARPNSTLFYLKKGVESTNPVAPTVTTGGMLISEVLVTSSGFTSTPITSIIVDLNYIKGKGTTAEPLSFSDAFVAETKAVIHRCRVDQEGNIIYIPFENRINLDYLHTIVNVSVFDNYQISYGSTTGSVRSSLSELQDDINALTTAQVTAGYVVQFRIVLLAGKSFACAILKTTNI